jgi:hypothetical protein
MRPIEAWLSITNVLTFFILAIPLPRAVFWMRYLAPIALLIAVIQILVEGPRWQMILTYMLTGLFLLAWLFQNLGLASAPSGQLLINRLVIGLGILGLAASVVLPIILPVLQFPHPSGANEIGTLTYHWTDTERPELFTTDRSVPRELMLQIWYPAKQVRALLRAPYMQE